MFAWVIFITSRLIFPAAGTSNEVPFCLVVLRMEFNVSLQDIAKKPLEIIQFYSFVLCLALRHRYPDPVHSSLTFVRTAYHICGMHTGVEHRGT